MARAELLFRFRHEFDDGAIVEAVIWEVPTPVAGCSHPYKYRLFYGFPGERIIGYDNERPKGDHRHQGKTQTRYRFESPEQLIDDFLRDVESRRK